MTDEPRWCRVEDTTQHEATIRCDDDNLPFVISCPTLGERKQHQSFQFDAFAIVGVAPPNGLIDKTASIGWGYPICVRGSHRFGGRPLVPAPQFDRLVNNCNP